MVAATCSNVGDVTSALLPLQAFAKRLDHTNWKERNAALEALEEMVKAAGSRITPSLGEALPALKVRRMAMPETGTLL